MSVLLLAVGILALVGLLIVQQRRIAELRRNQRELPAGGDSQLSARDLIEAIPCPVFYKALDGRYLGCNRAFSEYLGRPREEIVGRTVHELAPRELADRYAAADAALFAQTGSQSYEVKMQWADGSLRDVVMHKATFAGADGPVRGLIGVITDITERKRAEDALSFVAQRGWVDGAEDFFEALVKFLGKTLSVDHVIVSRLTEDPGIAETVARYAKGSLAPNIRYGLKGTPCENVMGQRFCFYPQGIQQTFPEDALLVEMGARSYAGLPLWDSTGQPIGLIAMLDGKPRRDEAQVSRILQFMATRAAAELERERNDRMLQRSEREFRTLAENMPDRVIRYDRQARVQYANPALMTSIAPEFLPVLGESFTQTYPGSEGAAWCERVVEQVIATGAPAEVEFEMANPQGELRLNHVRFVAERDEHGEIVGALGIGRDITERKASERQLRQALEFTEGVINAIPDLLFEADRNGTCLNIWARTPELLAVHQEALLGKRFSDVVAPDTAEVALAALREADEKGLSFGKVLRVDIPQGERWFELSVSRKPGSDMPGHFIVLSRDITERRRMEEDIRRRELEFRSLAENMPDNVVRYDRQARVLYMNPAILASVAPDFLPVLGESPIETYPDRTGAVGHQRIVEQVIATGIPTEWEFQTRNPQGEIRIHHARYVAERDGNGEIVGVLGLGRDITERKRAETYEQFRSQTLELLAGGASLHLVLESIVRGVEQLNPGTMCSILLLDAKGKRLGEGIAPSLPDFYNAAVDGIEIGVGIGCCGTAAATGERVIVEDIQTHSYWAPYKELAARAGLGACWSEPIRSSTGQVLGTFATYHREAHWPAEFDISLIEKSTHLASIAIERRQAEETLRASEQEFRTLAENLPDFLVRYDREGRRTYVNPALERSFGIAAEQMIGKTLRETNPVGMAMMETYQRALEHTLATGERSEFEMQIPLPGGDMLTGQCFMVAERAADGRISSAIALSRDITERKRMESEIRRREREFRSLAENSPDPIFRYDRDCRRIYANPVSSAMSGHPLESLIGATPGEGQLLAADDAAKLTAGIRRVFDSGESGCVDLVAVDRDGKRREFQMLLVPEEDDRGEVATVLGIAHDITAIRDAERQMTDFVANLPGFAFTFRLSPEGHGSFPFASPGIEDLAGLKPADVKDDMAPLLARAHPDDAPRILAAIGESARTLTPYHEEARACLPGLPPRWVELRAIPLRQADGSTVWHGLMLDIDERKHSEAELEKHRHHLENLVEDRTHALLSAKETAEAATHAKTQFLAAASHDLRQPLQAIGLLQGALAKTCLNEQQKKISLNLSRSVNSLGEILNQLLDVSKLDASMLEPQPEVIPLDELLGTIAAEFDSVVCEKNLRLNLFCPRRGPALFIDRNLLLNILRNLVGNAVKYTNQGGVLVGIRRRDNRALIQVWDTGIGIAPEQVDSIFEEYFQVGNPERGRAKGVGLGLAIVRRLSELLGTHVRCRSRVGKGSVFELSLPLATESVGHAVSATTGASGPARAPGRLAGKRIVVIEDDAMAGEALKLSLETHGMEVIHFVTAEDALAGMEAGNADFYISDYGLPGMDGLQLLDAIQENSTERIKALLLTGNTSPDQIRIMQSSGWKVLFKPVDLAELLSAIEAHKLDYSTGPART